MASVAAKLCFLPSSREVRSAPADPFRTRSSVLFSLSYHLSCRHTAALLAPSAAVAKLGRAVSNGMASPASAVLHLGRHHGVSCHLQRIGCLLVRQQLRCRPERGWVSKSWGLQVTRAVARLDGLSRPAHGVRDLGKHCRYRSEDRGIFGGLLRSSNSSQHYAAT
jgi:hypothetical protein